MSETFTYVWKDGKVIGFPGPVMSYEVEKKGLTACHMFEPMSEVQFWNYHSDKWFNLKPEEVDKEFRTHLLLLGIA